MTTMATSTDRTTTTRDGATPPDFSDVYAAQLAPVWRFVRARIPDHAEAHDVTSDVFVRAWRAWGRFDPTRGPVEPWLFTIAARAVADWHRARRPEPVDATDAATATTDGAGDPEPAALKAELLAALGDALADLSDREREGLALRFAARLSSTHVAEVLGTSPEAAKQMLHRAIGKLRDRTLGAAPRRSTTVADLEAVVDDVLARGHATLATSELHGLLVHMAALHEPAVPEDLSPRVAECISCEVETDTTTETPSRRGVVGGGIAGLLLYGPACLACGIPWAGALLGLLGLGSAGLVVHEATLVTAPIVAWLAWRGYRRHGRPLGYRLALAGALVLLFHTGLHVGLRVAESVHPATMGSTMRFLFDTARSSWFGLTDVVGGMLVVVGALVHLVHLRAWRANEALGLQRHLVIEV